MLVVIRYVQKCWYRLSSSKPQSAAARAGARPRRVALNVLLTLLLGGGGLVLGYGYYTIQQPLDFGGQVYVIEKGATLTAVANDLTARNIIREPYSLRLLGRWKHLGRQIQSGRYRFPPGIRLGQFLQWTARGKGQLGYKLTIIEGWTFQQMRARIDRAPNLRHDTAGLSDQEIMQKLGYPALHPEGQFYPDTYRYQAGASDLTLYKIAFQLMQEKLQAAWQQRGAHIQIKSPYEALIMASIIEKETQFQPELTLVSGVFDNRLRVGMRLQTDPSVIYGVGLAYRGDITRKHLETDTPYNTYTRYGLPPTPISLPSAAALLAAVRPQSTPHYYFVAKGNGEHKFSRTLKEHNRAVNKYLRGKS